MLNLNKFSRFFFLSYFLPGHIHLSLLESWHELRALSKAAIYSQFLYVHVGQLKLGIDYVQDSVNSCSLSRQHHKCAYGSFSNERHVPSSEWGPSQPSTPFSWCQLIIADFSHRKKKIHLFKALLCMPRGSGAGQEGTN